eukprot:scaffold1181_cov57-Attheya_sp.AAC.2
MDKWTKGRDKSSLGAVVFLVGRDADGTEAFTRLASSGSLPGVSEKYNSATAVHHHISGIESSRAITEEAKAVLDGEAAESRVVEISLNEFNRKLTSLSEEKKPASPSVEDAEGMSKKQHVAQKRSNALAAADIFVVSISSSTDPSLIDSSIVSAIDNAAVKSVVVAGIRSSDEVQHERKLAVRQKNAEWKESKVSRGRPTPHTGRRRLEDNGDDNNDDSSEGVYYVNATPNMLAGILFMLMFAFIAIIGFQCMGMIQGQDVYVKKMPLVGREA